MPITDILHRVLHDIKPTPQEEQHVHAIVNNVQRTLHVKDARIILGGSGAKNTWLSHTTDIDLYVSFDYAAYKTKSTHLADIIERHLKKTFKRYLRLHGSRDYFQVTFKGYTIEIIPILSITRSTKAQNITDVSLLHVKHIKQFAQQSDDMRLAKQFARAQNVYGAESYIKGFSGYVLELLVAHYGSFLRLLKAASRWKHRTIIGSKNAVQRLNNAKKASPLILIDPVQSDRNVAAALSQEKYTLFKKACQRFLARPSRTFFTPRTITITALKKKGHVSVITAQTISPKRDIGGAKALKAFEFLLNHLNEFGITSRHFDYDGKTITFTITTRTATLKPTMKLYGPPFSLTNTNALERFKQAHKKAAIIKDTAQRRYAIITKRPHSTLRAHLTALLAATNIRQRLKKPSLRVYTKQRP